MSWLDKAISEEKEKERKSKLRADELRDQIIAREKELYNIVSPIYFTPKVKTKLSKI